MIKFVRRWPFWIVMFVVVVGVQVMIRTGGHPHDPPQVLVIIAVAIVGTSAGLAWLQLWDEARKAKKVGKWNG